MKTIVNTYSNFTGSITHQSVREWSINVYAVERFVLESKLTDEQKKVLSESGFRTSTFLTSYRFVILEPIVPDDLTLLFLIRIVVTDSWPPKARNNSQLIIKCAESDTFHRFSVIRMNKIRMTVFLSAGCIKQF